MLKGVMIAEPSVVAGLPIRDPHFMNHGSDPLHGVTLEQIVTALEARYGWALLGEKVAIRCFTENPSVKSSLKFLRRTPWARAKVESLYVNAIAKKMRQKTPTADPKPTPVVEPTPTPRVIPAKWKSF